jgi:hypothetical protein
MFYNISIPVLMIKRVVGMPRYRCNDNIKINPEKKRMGHGLDISGSE